MHPNVNHTSMMSQRASVLIVLGTLLAIMLLFSANSGWCYICKRSARNAYGWLMDTASREDAGTFYP